MNTMQQPSTSPLTQDEMRANLSNMSDMADNAMRDLYAEKYRSDNKAEASRVENLKKVLEMMKQNGIDPNDPNQIQQFLNQLQQSNPDMYEIFVDALNTLMSGEEAPQVPGMDQGEQMPGMEQGQMPQQDMSQMLNQVPPAQGQVSQM